MRHGLLMTAVATVTVPGLLAMLAVVGHEHVAAEAGVSRGGARRHPAVRPVSRGAGDRARRGAQQRRGGAASVGHAGDGAQPGDGQASRSWACACSTGAADAAWPTSYQGTELISQSGVDGSVKMISQVWHQGGG